MKTGVNPFVYFLKIMFDTSRALRYNYLHNTHTEEIMNLKKSLRIAIAIKEMTQGDLADQAGYSRQQVTNWITRDRIPQPALVKICDVLGMQVSEFIALGEN